MILLLTNFQGDLCESNNRYPLLTIHPYHHRIFKPDMPEEFRFLN